MIESFMEHKKSLPEVKNPIVYGKTKVLYLNGTIAAEVVNPIIESIIEINEEYAANKIKQELLDNYIQNPSNDSVVLLEDNGDAPEILPNDIPRDVYINQQLESITLVINSPGGKISTMKSLIGIMKTSLLPVNTVTYSDIASAASLIFLNGKERYIHKDATIMFHNISDSLNGDQVFIKRRIVELNESSMRFIDEIAKLSNIPKRRLKAMLNKREDWVLFGDQLHEYTIATHLIVD